MSITTYSQLQAASANWLVRADLTARIPEFISCAEARAQKAEGELERMREALTRLGSMEAFTIPRSIDKERDAELLARIDFARQALPPSDKTLTQSSTS